MDELNMYFVQNNKNPNGGRFYNIYVNEGEKLDLTKFDTTDIDKFYSDVREVDSTFKKAGGLIIGGIKKINSVSMYSEDKGGVNISTEVEEAYNEWLDLDEKSNELYEQLTKIQKEKNQLSEKIKTRKRGK